MPSRRAGRLSPVLAVLVMAAVAGCAGSAAPPAAQDTQTGAGSSAPGGSGAPTGSPVPAGSGGSPAAPGPATAPAAGSTLATIDYIGQTNVVSNSQGSGFTAVHYLTPLNSTTDESTLQTYDSAGNLLATLPAGSFTGACGAADVVNTAGRLIITLLVTTTPAQGITAPSYSESMTAWNAATGASVWTASLVKNQGEAIDCPLGDGELANFVSTLNGQWGVLELPPNGDNVSYDAIDLTTGKLYPNPNLQGVLGNDVVTGSGTSDDGSNGPVNLTVTIPGSWPRLGTAAGSGAQGGNPQLSGDTPSDEEFAPQNFAVPGYTGDMGDEGDGLGAVATPDGGYLVTVSTNENDNSADEQAYALPSLRQVWNDPVPQYTTDLIVGITDSTLLIARTANGGDSDTYLLALDPSTGQKEWQVDIGSGSVCDLTSSQVLVEDNSQLATLSAATGKQLSYESDPYQDDSGDPSCPIVIETGLGGTGMNNNNQVIQLLAP